MNEKRVCACSGTIELHDAVEAYDSPDTVKAKRFRFDTKIADWTAAHGDCLKAWRKRMEAL